MSSFDRKRKIFESVYSRRIEREIRRYGASVALQIEDGIAPQTFLLSGQFLSREKMNNTLKNLWNTTGTYYVGYARRQLRRMKLDVPDNKTWGQWVDSYFETDGAQKVETIVSTQQDRIRKVISNTIEAGNKEGLAVQKISKNITEALKGEDYNLTSRFNAMRIARTEVGMASSTANYQTNLQLGDRIVMQWITARDRAVRGVDPSDTHDHISLDGLTRENKIDAVYPGTNLRHPNDPKGEPGMIINCRCIERPIPNPNL